MGSVAEIAWRAQDCGVLVHLGIFVRVQAIAPFDLKFWPERY